MSKISELDIDFSGGATRNQLEQIVNKINELVRAENKRMTLEVNLNQEYGDATRTFDITEALTLSKSIMKAAGLRLRFLGKSGRYTEYSYTGDTLDDNDWMNLDNWCTVIETIDGGEF